MESFDDFKKYHNANYHDGDSAFDELNYKKSNGDDFDIQFVQDCFDHFEAGQQSKQDEVDELQHKLKCERKISLFADKLCCDLQGQVDELQKRIDEALAAADESCGVSIAAFVKLNKILKGDQS